MFILSQKVRAYRCIRDTLAKCACKSRYRTCLQPTESTCRCPYRRGTNLSDTNQPIEHSDSDYESDPAGDTARSERNASDVTLRREPEIEVPEYNMYAVAADQEDYPGAGEAIGEVKEYKEECRDLCKNPWAQFASAQGFKLASWFIESKVSKTRINDYFSNGIGNSISVGYSSMHTLENLLRHLDPYSPYRQWL